MTRTTTLRARRAWRRVVVLWPLLAIAAGVITFAAQVAPLVLAVPR